MPNPNYVKGVKKERALVNEARAKGLIAFRSAGSHSPIDVCIIDIKQLTIRFIQCKPDAFSERNKFKLMKSYGYLEGDYKVSYEVL